MPASSRRRHHEGARSRAGDIIARYGGPGKFGIVLGTDCRGAMVAERIRIGVEQMHKPNPASTAVQSSREPRRLLRHARSQGAWQDIELIAAAERALAQAQEAGRNTVALDTHDAAVRS